MRRGGSAGQGLVSSLDGTGASAAGATGGAVGTTSVTPRLGIWTFGVEGTVTADGTVALAGGGAFSGVTSGMETGSAAARLDRVTRRFALRGLRIRVDFVRPTARAAGAGLDFRATFGLALRGVVFLRTDRRAAGGDANRRLALFPGLVARGFFNFMPAKYPS